MFGMLYEVGSVYKFVAQFMNDFTGVEDYSSFDYVHAYDVTKFQGNIEAAYQYFPDVRHKDFYILPKGSNILLISLYKDGETIMGIFLYDEHFLLLELRSNRGARRCQLSNIHG